MEVRCKFYRKEDDFEFRFNKIREPSYVKHLAITAITGQKNGQKEISAIIVSTDVSGFKINTDYEKMGLNATSNTTEWLLENVVVAEENLLGVRGEKIKDNRLAKKQQLLNIMRQKWR